MLGELYSAAFTAPAFNWLCSPAVTELETIVLDWMARLMNLPACFLSDGEGGGVIQGSASEAVVTVMVAARERYLDRACEGRQGEEREMKKADVRGRMVALGSEQSHSSTAKAAIIAGVRYMSISCRMEDELALTGAGLQKVIDECKQQGLIPFYLTTMLGTTATCAIDRFDEIKEVAKDWPDMWIHVDAAYAGGALVCEEYQHLTEHLEAFDSFDINMHKWLLTNFDARYHSFHSPNLFRPTLTYRHHSCLYIKRRRNLTDALSITPSYLRNDFSDSGLVTDYRDWQIPLGRRFRSLKIWFVLRTYGVEGLKAHIRNHIRLGERFHSWVLGRPDLFRVVTPPAFALTVLTVVPRAGGKMEVDAGGASRPGVSDGLAKDGVPETEDQGLLAANRITKEVYELVNLRGEIFLTSGVVNGVYAIRVVSANPKADEEHLRKAFDILVATAEEVLGRLGEGSGVLTNGVGGH